MATVAGVYSDAQVFQRAVGWVNGRACSWALDGTCRDNSFPKHRIVAPWVETHLRPWDVNEVPLGAWVRDIGGEERWLLNHTLDVGNRADWLENCEHSTDEGKTWLPCGVEVKP